MKLLKRKKEKEEKIKEERERIKKQYSDKQFLKIIVSPMRLLSNRQNV